MPILMPPKKPSMLSSLLPAAGAAVGGAYGGAGGAAIGGAAGSALGSAGQRDASNPAIQSTAMQRRMDAMDHDETLRQGEKALAALPPEYQQQYGPSIIAARQASMQRGVT